MNLIQKMWKGTVLWHLRRIIVRCPPSGSLDFIASLPNFWLMYVRKIQVIDRSRDGNLWKKYYIDLHAGLLNRYVQELILKTERHEYLMYVDII